MAAPLFSFGDNLINWNGLTSFVFKNLFFCCSKQEILIWKMSPNQWEAFVYNKKLTSDYSKIWFYLGLRFDEFYALRWERRLVKAIWTFCHLKPWYYKIKMKDRTDERLHKWLIEFVTVTNFQICPDWKFKIRIWLEEWRSWNDESQCCQKGWHKSSQSFAKSSPKSSHPKKPV